MNVFVKAVHSDKAPKALGPYSQATKLGDFVYLSGQLGIDPNTGELAGETMKEQAEQAMKNIGAMTTS